MPDPFPVRQRDGGQNHTRAGARHTDCAGEWHKY